VHQTEYILTVMTLIAGPHTLEGPDSFLSLMPFCLTLHVANTDQTFSRWSFIPFPSHHNFGSVTNKSVTTMLFSDELLPTASAGVIKEGFQDVLIFMCTDFARVS